MIKAGHGDGTWSKTSSGLDRIQFTVELPDGTIKRPAVTGHSKGECREKRKKKEEELKRGIGVQANSAKVTVEEWLKTWLNDYVQPKSKVGTYNRYKYIVNHYIVPVIGLMKLRELRGDAVQHLLNDQIKRGLSTATIRLIYVVIHSGLRQAVKVKLIADNVSDSCEIPTVKNRKMEPLDIDQAGKLLQVIENHKLKAAFYLLQGLPLRIGELVGLKWENIDIEAGMIKIEQIITTNGGVRVETPKTEESRRTLALPPELVKELRTHKAKQAVKQLKAGDLWQEGGWVFCNEIGDHIHPNGLRKIFKQALKDAGLPTSIRVHDTRHTAVTRLIEAGLDMKLVQSMCGHKNIATTLNIYAHTSDEQLKKAADVLNEVIVKSKLKAKG